MRSLITLGETMARLALPEHGLAGAGTALALGVGGAESNVAIAASRLGIPSTWIGRVGDDDLGSLVLRQLRGEGVRVIADRDPAAPTGLMIKEHRAGRPSAVRYYRSGSAGSRLTPADLDEAAIAEAGLLHLTGITAALGSTATDTVDRAVELARAAGTTVSFDVNYRSSLWPVERAAPVLNRILGSVDLVFAGLEEAALVVTGRAVAPTGDPWVCAAELAGELTRRGPEHVVIKLGELGAWAVRDGQVDQVPAQPVAVVDTVGAGDAFVGGYLAAFLSGRDLRGCLTTGTRMGALVCGTRGDWEGALDWRGGLDEPDRTQADASQDVLR